MAEIHKLYRCHDRLLEHKEALFGHLTERWRDLFAARFDLLLYDLTSTYFEAEPPFGDDDKRRFGYSRDRRPDCVQVVIALVVTPEGLPLAYEVLAGNTSDKTTLRDFLAKIERQYGKARRVWLMDRGIPTEETLAEMREADPPVQYLVGTPKGRLSRLEQDLAGEPWQEARSDVQVKLLPMDGELYVFAQSLDRVAKERAMRRRQLKGLWARLKDLHRMSAHLTRDELLIKLGQAKAKWPTGWRLVDIQVDAKLAAFRYALDRDKLRRARRREGRYLLRSNLTETDPATLWSYYLQLVQVEEAFRTLKGDLAIRPIHHQEPWRIEAHIFIAFLAYCLHVTLGRRLQSAGAGPDPAQRVREIRRRSDDRRAHPDHRRSRTAADPLYPARARADPASRTPPSRPARPAAPQNHRRRRREGQPRVVPTFRGWSQTFQCPDRACSLESANFG